MRRYRFLQLDVFTDEPFGGNQLAVFTTAAGLSGAEMQAIAREMNYSETAFVLPADDPKALYRVRIFTPSVELPLAGHPTIGTTFALAQEGKVRAEGESPIYLQLGVGILPVDVLFEGQSLAFAWMHQPIPTFTPWDGDRARLAAALGIAPTDFADELPIERGSAAVPFVYIPVRSREVLAQAHPSADLVAALNDLDTQVGAYLFTLEASASDGMTTRSRMFAPGMGIAEDPATGAAAGPFGVYLLCHGRITPDEIGEARVRISQGVEMGRPSQIDVAVAGPADAVRDVRVGGQSVLIAEGDLLLPDAADE